MAITLGEIAVRLTANTAEFISGFGNAATSAKRFRADLSEHIGAVGEVVERGLASFGEFGETVGGVLGRAGAAASQAVVSFGKLGGSMGTVLGIGAGVAVALASAEAGIIGITIRSAESAAKLGEMAEKAGVSTQTLAGLSFAGRGVGVETESLVKSFGFLSSNLVKSATSADFSHTALGRLGLSLKDIKDSSGNIKDLGEIFPQIAAKIASLPSSEQGAFVKAIFGRGGLEILPLILEGADKINEKMAQAQAFGLGDPQAVAASRQFKETVDEIKAQFEGMALILVKDLLPAIEAIAKNISDAFSSGRAKEFVADMAQLVKYTLAAGAAFVDLVKFAFDAIAALNPSNLSRRGVEIGGKIAEGLKTGNIGAIRDAFREIGSVAFKPETDFASAFKDANAILNAKAPAVTASTAVRGGVDLSPAQEDTTLARLKERLEALRESQNDWADTARAASEAETLISKAVQKSNEEFRKFTEFAARDKTGASQKFIATHEAQIRAAAASVFYDQQIVKTSEDLDKQGDTLRETDNAAIALANAYKQGGEAVASAALDKQFAKEAAAIAELAGVRDVAALKAKLERNEALARKVAGDELQASLDKETASTAVLAPAVERLNLAYLRGEDAVRRERIELELQQFAQSELAKGVVLTAAQIEQKRKILQQADSQAYEAQLAQEAAQFNLNAQYDNTIVRLQRMAEMMRQNGVSTLGVEAQIFDEQNRLIHQWDEWAFKVGTLGQKFRGVMNELVIQGRQAGAAIMQAIGGAIDGIESQLAKLLTGQKTDFKGVFTSLAESVTKAQIQRGVGALAEHFGFGKLLGLTQKADGSQNNPFWVVIKNAATAGGESAGIGSLIGGLGSSGESTGPRGGFGGFFSGLGSLFGGFKAGGGPMAAGNWYIAGERGPEIVQGPGNVIPAGPTYNITHNHNYPTAGSRDLFGRTQKQNQARQMRNSRLAYGF